MGWHELGKMDREGYWVPNPAFLSLDLVCPFEIPAVLLPTLLSLSLLIASFLDTVALLSIPSQLNTAIMELPYRASLPWLLLLSLTSPCSCLPRAYSLPIVTAVPHPPRNDTDFLLLQKRSITTELSTCGYFKGDPDRPRTADTGYNCRIDVRNGLWGFCPTSVVAASDCGLAGSCYDNSRCSAGCGMTERTDLTTFSWCVTPNTSSCRFL
jgi:hypothetical protein